MRCDVAEHQAMDLYTSLILSRTALRLCIVNFKGDGSFQSGSGDAESRNRCTGKSLKQLQAEGRSFVLVN